MDISEKRIPQDGRMKLKVNADKVIDFRVSTLPTLFGEKIVIRILDPSSARLGIDATGYNRKKERLLKAIGRPYGMVLVTRTNRIEAKPFPFTPASNILNQPGVQHFHTAKTHQKSTYQSVNQVNVNDKADHCFSQISSFSRILTLLWLVKFGIWKLRTLPSKRLQPVTWSYLHCTQTTPQQH